MEPVTGADAKGTFSLVLPTSLHGTTVARWQHQRVAISPVPQLPGCRVDLRQWPTAPVAQAPTDLGSVTLPG